MRLKNLLLHTVLFLLLLPLGVAGQNHVFNCSFEDTIGCPIIMGQFASKCAGWKTVDQCTPDYFHMCRGMSAGVGVPGNNFGYQLPAHGFAYAGIVDLYPPHKNYREYLHSHIMPLQKNIAYEVSIAISRADYTQIATNGLGIFFYDTGYTNSSRYILDSVTPQVSFASSGTIKDSMNWVRYGRVFIPDSSYDNIIIGGFIHDSLITVDTVSTTGSDITYYYLDSIVIQIVDTLVVLFKDSMLCAKDTIHVNYLTRTVFNLNNTFTVQLSDKNGSFSNPVSIGSKNSYTGGTITAIIPGNVANGSGYRIRVVSSSIQHTSADNGFNINIFNLDSSNISVSSNSPICTFDSLKFTITHNVTSPTFQWTGPNSFSTTLQNPAIGTATSANAGFYYTTIKIFGCTKKDTLNISIKPLPSPPIVSSNTPVCAGDTLKLIAQSSTGGITYLWTGPNNFSSTTQNVLLPNSTTGMSGNYVGTAILNGCMGANYTTVAVVASPNNVLTSSNSPLCSGDTLKLSVTNTTTGVNYNWTGPNAFSSVSQNPQIVNSTINATGLYIATLSLNNCLRSDSVYVTVFAKPSMPILSHNSPLCIGETLTLNTGTITGATYAWAGPNNFSSSLQNPVRGNMQFGDTGTYSATVTVNNCISPAGTTKVNLNPLPFVVILSNPVDSICDGNPVLFTALPNNHGGTPQYQWYVNALPTTTGVAFSTATLNDNDIIHCEMTENTKCSVPFTDASNDIQMTVLPWLAPTVSITANPAHPLDAYEYVTFTAATTNAGNNPKYQWKRNGQNVVGATSNIWSANTLNDNDSIAVEIISNYKCSQPATAASNWIKVKMTGIGDISTNNRITVYPNPNNGKFIIEASTSAKEDMSFDIINTLGQVVYKDYITPANGIIRKEIDLGDVPKGVYMLRMYLDNEVSPVRINVR